jgi:hypothetical protein
MISKSSKQQPSSTRHPRTSVDRTTLSGSHRLSRSGRGITPPWTCIKKNSLAKTGMSKIVKYVIVFWICLRCHPAHELSKYIFKTLICPQILKVHFKNTFQILKSDTCCWRQCFLLARCLRNHLMLVSAHVLLGAWLWILNCILRVTNLDDILIQFGNLKMGF